MVGAQIENQCQREREIEHCYSRYQHRAKSFFFYPHLRVVFHACVYCSVWASGTTFYAGSVTKDACVQDHLRQGHKVSLASRLVSAMPSVGTELNVPTPVGRLLLAKSFPSPLSCPHHTFLCRVFPLYSHLPALTFPFVANCGFVYVSLLCFSLSLTPSLYPPLCFSLPLDAACRDAVFDITTSGVLPEIQQDCLVLKKGHTHTFQL